MNARFNDCLYKVLDLEKGYANTPGDRGGPTNYGVTQKTFDSWLIKHGYPIRHVKYIAMHEVWAIYDEFFWQVARCDHLAPPLDLAVFDAAVQHGAVRAAKWLQQIVGADDDGVIGRKTLRALEVYRGEHTVSALVEAYMAKREEFYAQIIANDPSQEKFKNGWANRVKQVREWVGA